MKHYPSDLMGLFKRLVFVALLAPLALRAEPTTDQAVYWLEKMSRAVHELNYDGYFVYMHDNGIESLRTVHAYDRGKETERLFSQNGEARELLKDHQSLTQIMPRQKNISTARRGPDSRSFSAFFKLDPQEIAQNYVLSFQGRDRVADRPVNVIAFNPSDSLRYGYRLYLDDEFAFPLQWEMFDHQQELVSRIMFTNIQLEKPQGAFADSAAVSEMPAVTSGQRIRSTNPLKSGWTFPDLPQGYSVRHLSTRHHPKSKNEINQLIFSDGLSSFSVFIEATDAARLNGKAKLGALNAYGVFLGGYQLTAVGEVPVEALIFISTATQNGALK